MLTLPQSVVACAGAPRAAVGAVGLAACRLEFERVAPDGGGCREGAATLTAGEWPVADCAGGAVKAARQRARTATTPIPRAGVDRAWVRVIECPLGGAPTLGTWTLLQG